MGFGGNLMWSGVVSALAGRGKKVVLTRQPKLSDVLAGRDFDVEGDLSSDPVFRNNPRVSFTPSGRKSPPARALDRVFLIVLEKLGQRRRWEAALQRRALARPDRLMVYVDMEIHSYAARQVGPPGRRRFEWKSGGHAIATMLASFAPDAAPMPPEIHLDGDDRARADRALREAGVDGAFLAVEPETNPEFFGDLRAWPFERWQAVADTLHADGLRIVQLGLAGARPLAGAADLRGKTDFRTACAVLEKASLFLGTESGLMHAARAVGTDATIIWGGVTLPEFAAYPDFQDVVCKRVACAPCGNQGWCENGRICMLDIGVEEVVARIRKRLDF